MSNYKAAFEAASLDLSAIMTLLGFTSYPGIDPMLRAITDLILAKADAQKLRDEVAALRKDKARLDRLDQLNAALNAKYGTTYRWQLVVNHNVNRLMLGHLQIDLNDQDCNGLSSCRDALDTIMPGASPEQGDSNA
ncbi:hypothetical protein P3W55_13825 [Pseudomonas citronellolis]|uniref:Uncharacterized protein n=1 Tax=Pseudomonas citronellolis TaxID=53408 RepID=A0AAW6P6D1_9PSED|nr:hypothetical protein [Pseudomonas citronellolis]MDF3842791.1 hypothetical protein [Pseudomonas citronellolis]